MIILGIETSCDETSAALLEIGKGGFKLIAHAISSSVKEQARYGGIVPEVAARKQMEFVIPVLQEAAAKIKPKEIDAIAVTVGPGLATALQVGIDAAKTLAYSWQKPLIPVNHLEGHLYSPLLPASSKLQITNNKLQKKDFPAIGLIVSGGHTELILVKDYLDYELLGRTRDDAVGEAFDKVAKLLGLGYPGGSIISKLAEKGDSNKFDFPRGMIGSGDYDFSFSGLKTSVLYKFKELNLPLAKGERKRGSKSEIVNNLSASFQQAAVDVLVAKTTKALKEYKAKTLLVGGGVAANPLLRKSLEDMCKKFPITYNLTPITYAGDNAAMIALTGYYRYKAGDHIKPNPQSKAFQQIKAEPNLKLV